MFNDQFLVFQSMYIYLEHNAMTIKENEVINKLEFCFDYLNICCFKQTPCQIVYFDTFPNYVFLSHLSQAKAVPYTIWWDLLSSDLMAQYLSVRRGTSGKK